MRHHGNIQNPTVAVWLAESSRLSSVSQYRETYKPGVRKALDVRDPEALSRKEGETNMAKRAQGL